MHTIACELSKSTLFVLYLYRNLRRYILTKSRKFDNSKKKVKMRFPNFGYHFGESLKLLVLLLLGFQLSGVPLSLLNLPNQELISFSKESEEPKPVEGNNTADFLEESKFLIDVFTFYFFYNQELLINQYRPLLFFGCFARLDFPPPRLA